MNDLATKWPMEVGGRSGGRGLLSGAAWLFLLTLLALYVPIIAATATLWFTDDNYAHGVFIIPVCLWLLWLQRESIRNAVRRPTAWGLLPLALGLMFQTLGYGLNSKALAMISLIPTLAGAVLILHGPELFRICSFPIGFLIFTARWPGLFTDSLSQGIQRVSAVGSTTVMSLLGYAITRSGNLIALPGITLEVADVCSGFKKLIALLALSLVYGYLYRIGVAKRIFLFMAAVPIAVVANVIRVSALIAITSVWGERGLHLAHNGAEMFVLVISFGLMAFVGKWIGCKETRFFQ